MKGKEAINIVWQTLFPVKAFSERERVEIVFDDRNKQFKYALHVETLEELEGFISEYNGQVNIAICPNTREPKKFTRRTGKEAVKRQKSILLDIEDPDKHELTSPQRVREIIREVAQLLPENIRQAVKFSAYTGGGGQLCIELSRWAEAGEISIIYEWLKRRLKNIKYIDPKSFNYGQPQRLIGTINVKYGVETFIYKVNPQVKPLEVDLILSTWTAEQELENYTANQIDENKGKITNLREAIEEIKKKVRIKDLGFTGEEYGDYTSMLCPFHEESNPSFVVYQNEDGDLAIDFHDDDGSGRGEYYDIIKFYQKIYEKDFITAVRELAQRAGVKLIFSKEEKERIQKEQALAEFDVDEYIEEQLKITRIVRYRIEGEYHFDFWVENREGEEVPINTVSLFRLQDWKYGLKLFGAHTGYKPERLPRKVEEEAWALVIDGFFERSEKFEGDFDRSALPWEIELLKGILHESPGTDEIGDFILTRSRFVKFYDYEEDRTYININSLIRKLKAYPSFERANIQKVAKLLRRLGATPCKLYKDGYEVRVWELPEEWRPTPPTEPTEGSVGEQSLETQGEEAYTDTTTVISEKIFSDTTDKNSKNASVVAEETADVLVDKEKSTDTTISEKELGNWGENLETQAQERTDTTPTDSSVGSVGKWRQEEEDWGDIDEIPF